MTDYRPVLLLLTLIALSLACQKEEPEMETATASYEGCCDSSPVSFTVGVGRVFIPNIFTPNWDGLNDIFGPLTDGGIEQIILLETYDLAGNKMHQAANFTPNDLGNNNGWNALLPDTSMYEGKFSFRIDVVDLNGVQGTIEGHACAVPCAQPVNIDPSFYAFSIQHDSLGGFEPSFSNEEISESCFK
ncbi:MAG: gliding motility-associated C-terminal domain-containing protein [Phaeodactylibacter sp.]|nr:gliding motility-associated C-terminal domain-containing protein [Phaeodactylibacter sp.]